MSWIQYCAFAMGKVHTLLFVVDEHVQPLLELVQIHVAPKHCFSDPRLTGNLILSTHRVTQWKDDGLTRAILNPLF